MAFRNGAGVVLSLVITLFAAVSGFAQGDGARKEIAAAKERLHQMLAQVEELEADGQKKEARALARKADEWAEKIHHAISRLEEREGERQQARRDNGDPGKVMEGLEHGMVALKKLGRRGELERLKQVAREVRERMRGREGEGDPDGDGERRHVVTQLEILRMALPALKEAENREWVQLVERAIRRREVDLEGRRDEKAHAIRERAPNADMEVRALRKAVELWHKFGNEEKGEKLRQLTDRFWGRGNRGERDTRREHSNALEEAHARIRRLEQRVEELQGAVKELGAAVRRLTKRK